MLSIRNYLALFIALSLSVPAYSSKDQDGDRRDDVDQAGSKKHKKRTSSKSLTANEASSEEEGAPLSHNRRAVSKKRERNAGQEQEPEQQEADVSKKAAVESEGNLPKLLNKLQKIKTLVGQEADFLDDEIQKRWDVLSAENKQEVANCMAKFETVGVEKNEVRQEAVVRQEISDPLLWWENYGVDEAGAVIEAAGVREDKSEVLLWFDIFMAMSSATADEQLEKHDIVLFREAKKLLDGMGPHDIEDQDYFSVISTLSLFSESKLSKIVKAFEGNVTKHIEALGSRGLAGLISILDNLASLTEERFDDMLSIISEHHSNLYCRDTNLIEIIYNLTYGLANTPADRYGDVREALCTRILPRFSNVTHFTPKDVSQVIATVVNCPQSSISLVADYLAHRVDTYGFAHIGDLTFLQNCLAGQGKEKVASEAIVFLKKAGTRACALEEFLAHDTPDPVRMNIEFFTTVPQALDVLDDVIKGRQAAVKAQESLPQDKKVVIPTVSEIFHYLFAKHDKKYDAAFVQSLCSMSQAKRTFIMKLPAQLTKSKVDLLVQALPDNLKKAEYSSRVSNCLTKLTSATEEQVQAIVGLRSGFVIDARWKTILGHSLGTLLDITANNKHNELLTTQPEIVAGTLEVMHLLCSDVQKQSALEVKSYNSRNIGVANPITSSGPAISVVDLFDLLSRDSNYADGGFTGPFRALNQTKLAFILKLQAKLKKEELQHLMQVLPAEVLPIRRHLTILDNFAKKLLAADPKQIGSLSDLLKVFVGYSVDRKTTYNHSFGNMETLDNFSQIPLDRLQDVRTAARQIGITPPFYNCDADLAKQSFRRYVQNLMALKDALPEDLEEVTKAYSRLPRPNGKWFVDTDLVFLKTLVLMSREGMQLLVDLVEKAHNSNNIDKMLFGSTLVNFMQVIPFIPSETLRAIIGTEDLKGLFLEHLGDSLVDYVSYVRRKGEAQLTHLFEHWKALLEQKHKKRSQILCDTITRDAAALGLHEQHEMLQHAIRIRTVMDEANPKSPYVIHDQLGKKKLVPMDWSQLNRITGLFDELSFQLNPSKLAELGASLVLDLSSVPKYTSGHFIPLLKDLKAYLQSNPASLTEAAMIIRTDQQVIDANKVPDPELTEEQLEAKKLADAQLMDQLCKNFLAILDSHMKPTSHVCVLLDAPATLIEGSKLKCVLSYYSSIPDLTVKTQRLCQFLAGVQHCATGQDTAIQDHYIALPEHCRIRSQMGALMQFSTYQIPALTAMHAALQTVVSSRFSPESLFMQEVCRTGDIAQASHNINYIKSLIGDKVGLSEGVIFDINAQCIYPHLMALSMQEVMQVYYKHMDLNNLALLVKGTFDSQIRAEDKQSRGAIYNALNKICEGMKLPQEDLESWVEMKEVSDIDYVFDGITPRGVVRVMQHTGILDPMEEGGR